MLLIPLCIIQMTSDDDRNWMTDVYIRHADMMKRIAKRYLSSPQEVEDAIIQSCISIIRHSDQLREMEPAAVARYIAKTVHHQALENAQRLNRERLRFQNLSDENILTTADPQVAENRLVLMEEVEMVLQAIQRLPERQRVVLKMRVFDELEDSDIASRLSITESSVRKYVHNARKNLLKMLYAEDANENDGN